MELTIKLNTNDGPSEVLSLISRVFGVNAVVDGDFKKKDTNSKETVESKQTKQQNTKPKETTKDTDENAITFELVGRMLKTVATSHGKVIREKLNELGASRVSELDDEGLTLMYEFLNDLEV